MRTILLAFLALLCSGSLLFGQNKSSNPWSFIPERGLEKYSSERQIVPQAYQTLELDVVKMKSLLANAPMWLTPEAESEKVRLTLPMPDGTFQDFDIVEAPVMHPDLAVKFPMIKSYAGIGIDDPTAYLRFDMTQKGFHAMVRTSKSSTVYIDPYSTADIKNYISYYRKDFHSNEPFTCHFDEVNEISKKKKTPSFRMAGDCTFRTYVLALACTGEYADFHGGTTAGALAAMVTTMTRVNGVFENDISVHMELHPDTDDLIFLDPGSDPYSNGNGGAMLGQNQTTCDNTIGNSNYDIGHVFSTGGGGVAYLGALCNSSNKAGGVTGQNNPVGDPFDIDYVAHEMGHQYGANHTQNNNCNRNNATAMEPGSASTIMGYAGICSPNVQNNSDDYFHAISMQEMGNEITSGTNGGSGNGGNTCSTNTTFNDAPTANAGANYTIPVSTPFVLTGSGTDINGDTLTYTWEQMDNQTATMPPNATNTAGPAFRSFKGTTSPSRYLPRLQDLVNNVSPTWEVLASVNRSYNWRVTVRDNHFGGSCSEEDDMVVTVSNSSGPFLVTTPNTAVTWPALSNQTVTWDVANTTSAPVSAANVDIFLSTDGGFTYPIILATGTPNDGSHTVLIPDNQTAEARVMVRGAGNIFFDISNENFTIGPPENDFTFEVTPNNLEVCSPGNAVFNVDIGVTGTFSGNVSLAVSGLPTGATSGFSVNPVAAPGSSQLTIGNIGGVAPGTYTISVSGTGSTGTKSEDVELTIANASPGMVILQTPANGAAGVEVLPMLDWANLTGATSYSLQLASDAGFTNLLVDVTGLTDSEFTVASPLNINTVYYWRAKAINACGEGAFSSPFSFTTLNVVCSTFVSTNVPIAIPSSGTPTVTSTLDIPEAGTITDVNVLDLDVNHTWINDLVIKIESPTGTVRTLIDNICGNQNDILLSLDDEAANPYSSIPCPPNGGTYQPNESLSNFDGEDPEGTWTLMVEDEFNQDGGSIEGWSVEVCYTPACISPTVNAPTVTQPTCLSPIGAIVVNASGGGILEYSIDGGNNWQTSHYFINLPPDDYYLFVRLQTDPACSTAYSQNPVVIQPAPAQETYFFDSDGDGFGDPATSIMSCSPPANFVSNDLDCDDDNANISPTATETCNGIDDNCNGQTDEGVTTTFYADSDGDGYGNPLVSQEACSAPPGYVTNSNDCDDEDGNEYPGQNWHLDFDGDGYSEGTSTIQCERPANHFTETELIATIGDCDDDNENVNPGVTETCNGIDDDCDTMIDEGLLTTYFADPDADGFGDPANSIEACTQPSGYVLDNTDNCPNIYNPDQDDVDSNGEGDICQDCPVNLTLYPYAPIQTTFQVQQNLMTSGAVIVPNGSSREYKAGTSTTLNADFEVELGGELDVIVELCTPLQQETGKEE